MSRPSNGNENTKILEYKLNELITLKLEDGKTNIYVKEEKVRQCKYLLLDIPIENFKKLNRIKSVDHVSRFLDHSLEPYRTYERNVSLPPEVEFWGHCSNLQAWMENDYDTRIIDSRLGFTLLERMKEAGYTAINNIYRKEIIKRLKSGWLPTIEHILTGNHLRDFTEEEIELLLQDIKEAVKKILLFEDPENEGRRLPINNPDFKTILRNGYMYFLDDEDRQNIPRVQALRKICLKLIEKQREFRSVYHKAITLQVLNLTPQDRDEFFERAFDDDGGLGEGLPLAELVKDLVLMGYFGALTKKDIENHPKLQQVESLEFCKFNSNYSLRTFPIGIVHLKSLKHLKVSRYFLKIIPDSITELGNLMTLDLSENRVKRLPESIGNLKSLEILILKQNQLESLPESIGNLKSLEILIVQHNYLESIPESIGQLSSLKELDLAFNNIEELPTQITSLINLQKLNLTTNTLRKLPEDISKLVNLETLKASYILLKAIPESFGELKNLIHLDIDYNELSEFPEQICYLKTLENLDLSGNNIEKIPDCIGNLENLKNLNIGFNNIIILPESIGSLDSLKKLNLSELKIKSFPKSFSNLKNIEWLKIWSSKLKYNIEYNIYIKKKLKTDSIIEALIRDGIL